MEGYPFSAENRYRILHRYCAVRYCKGIAAFYQAGTITKNPSVSVSLADNSSFTTDTKKITLTASNATKATYKIDNGEAVEFTGSKEITIGEGVDFGNSIKVTVHAEGEEGTTPKT